MNKTTKAEIGIASACLIALGSTAVAVQFTDNKMNTRIESNSAMVSESSAPVIETTAEFSTTGILKSENSSDISLSFSAVPDAKLSSEKVLVFTFDDSSLIVKADSNGIESNGAFLNVKGDISSVDGNIISLKNCNISSESSDDNKAAVTEKQDLTETSDDTVYVSSTGKYHSRSDCSGMVSYTEMSIDKAKSNGFDPCKKCY